MCVQAFFGVFVKVITGFWVQAIGFKLEVGAATAEDVTPALPSGPSTMGIMVHSLLWVTQD